MGDYLQIIDMNGENLKSRIEHCLRSTIYSADKKKSSVRLLNTLGYESQRKLDIPENVDDFVNALPAANQGTNLEISLRSEVKFIHSLFQVTNSEINLHSSNNTLFDSIEDNNFLFFTVELRKSSYSRSQYAAFTREINKRFLAPVVIFFFTENNLLTIAFVARRRNLKDDNRDVLEKVSLIKDISLTNPHRAHIDILYEISLTTCIEWMSQNGYQQNFDGLLKAWLIKLDIKELNKMFYKDLFNWYSLAIKKSNFPLNADPEKQVIRLITRILFIWFLKEKKLVNEKLFNETEISSLLKKLDPNGFSYYQFVLKRLFFEILNTEVEKRASEYGNRRNPAIERRVNTPSRAQKLFENTPFINGGLFDFDPRLEDNELNFPNQLFFGKSDSLFQILERYKFTIEENTPVEQEIALDPELLGQVFENLLATYNPETQETARNETGSFYTPREVVNYIVEEALVARLAGIMGANDELKKRIHKLIACDDTSKNFADWLSEDTKRELVKAICKLRILDPAVGSGAFPMSALLKLNAALRQLDPRCKELSKICDTFNQFPNDYGRKLYLIENCIYGVDIQPIACHIAKLRFFISLLIDQQQNKNVENFGIRPLPNLETRFVAADTLQELTRHEQPEMFNVETDLLIEELQTCRNHYFSASSSDDKRFCLEHDSDIRRKLKIALKKNGVSNETAEKLFSWIPYDQNAKSDWFDAEFMLGVNDGFDIVIGNPPYIQLQKNRGKLGKKYSTANFTTLAKTGDIYQLFYEKGMQLLKEKGWLCYITSNKWLRAKYGEKTRKFLANYNPKKLLDFRGNQIFESATVDTNVLLVQKSKYARRTFAVRFDEKFNTKEETIPEYAQSSQICLNDLSSHPWIILRRDEMVLKRKIEKIGTPLKDWDINIYRGITTGLNKAFIIDNDTKNALVSEDSKSVDLLRPLLRGRDIGRYQSNWKRMWIIDTHNGFGNTARIDVDLYPAIKQLS